MLEKATNTQFVLHNSLFSITFRFVLHVSALFPARYQVLYLERH